MRIFYLESTHKKTCTHINYTYVTAAKLTCVILANKKAQNDFPADLTSNLPPKSESASEKTCAHIYRSVRSAKLTGISLAKKGPEWLYMPSGLLEKAEKDTNYQGKTRPIDGKMKRTTTLLNAESNCGHPIYPSIHPSYSLKYITSLIMLTHEPYYPVNQITLWIILPHASYYSMNHNTPWFILIYELLYPVNHSTPCTIFPPVAMVAG